MNTRFVLFLTIGLAVIGVSLAVMFSATKGAHLRIDGKILKVRVMELPEGKASLVFVDFRAANPSNVQFVTGEANMILTTAAGEKQEGTPVSKPEVDKIFQYQKLLGPKYNDVLSLQDHLAPHATLDRMMGARFELSEAGINMRKNLRIRVEDVDGAVAEILETPEKAK